MHPNQPQGGHLCQKNESALSRHWETQSCRKNDFSLLFDRLFFFPTVVCRLVLRLLSDQFKVDTMVWNEDRDSQESMIRLLPLRRCLSQERCTRHRHKFPWRV